MLSHRSSLLSGPISTILQKCAKKIKQVMGCLPAEKSKPYALIAVRSFYALFPGHFLYFFPAPREGTGHFCQPRAVCVQNAAKSRFFGEEHVLLTFFHNPCHLSSFLVPIVLSKYIYY